MQKDSRIARHHSGRRRKKLPLKELVELIRALNKEVARILPIVPPTVDQ